MNVTGIGGVADLNSQGHKPRYQPPSVARSQQPDESYEGMPSCDGTVDMADNPWGKMGNDTIRSIPSAKGHYQGETDLARSF